MFKHEPDVSTLQQRTGVSQRNGLRRIYFRLNTLLTVKPKLSMP
jgi:hypothetical protein